MLNIFTGCQRIWSEVLLFGTIQASQAKEHLGNFLLLTTKLETNRLANKNNNIILIYKNSIYLIQQQQKIK